MPLRVPRRPTILCLLALLIALPLLALSIRNAYHRPFRILQTLSAPDNVGFPLAFSPDHSTLITNDAPGPIQAWNLHTGRLRFSALSSSNADFATFSPDGRLLAVRDDFGGLSPILTVLRTSNGAIVREIATDSLLAVRFLPSSPTLELLQLIDGPDSQPFPYSGWTLRSFDIKTWSENPARTTQHPLSRPLAVSPNARRLAVHARLQQDLTIIDADALLPPLTLSDPAATALVTVAAFSADGSTLALGRDEGTVEAWSLSRPLLARHRCHAPGFSPWLIELPGNGKTFYETALANPRSTLPGRMLDRLKAQFPSLFPPSNPHLETVVWDLGRPHPREHFPEHYLQALTPDGTLGAWSPDFGKTIQILDLRPAP